MHAVYAADRELYYTRATLNEMMTKGIEILSPTVFLEVFLDHTTSTLRAEPAFEALYHQLKHNKGHIRLDIDHCKILQRINLLVFWEILNWMPSGWPKLRCRNLPDDHSKYWFFDQRRLPSHQIFYLGEDTKDSIKVGKLKARVKEDSRRIIESAIHRKLVSVLRLGNG